MDKLAKPQLSKSVRRFIKRKEKELNRKCRMIWKFTNQKDETYIFANFCRNYDKLIVTLAYYDKRIHQFLVTH